MITCIEHWIQHFLAYLVAACWLVISDPKDDDKKTPKTVNKTTCSTGFILLKLVLPNDGKLAEMLDFSIIFMIN